MKIEGIDIENNLGISFFSSLESINFDSNDIKVEHPIMRIFKMFWSENGDYMKHQYCGSWSNTKSVTLNGSENVMEEIFNHKKAALSKYINESFFDKDKQEAIETFLQLKDNFDDSPKNTDSFKNLKVNKGLKDQKDQQKDLKDLNKVEKKGNK